MNIWRIIQLTAIMAAGLALSGMAAETPAKGEPWPGVKITYFKGADLKQPILTAYDRELRFDGWVPLPVEQDGRRASVGPFSIRWECLLKIDQKGEYEFYVANDRGWGNEVVLALNGKPVEWTKREVEYEHRGKNKTKTFNVTQPATLEPGWVSVRMEYSKGKLEPFRLYWSGPGFKDRELSPARVGVMPWNGMKRRPLLRYAMFGHSNVEGRAGQRKPVEAKTAWMWSDGNWYPLTGYNNHVTGLTTALSMKYPDHFFGGMMLGKAASSVCVEWQEGQTLYLQKMRALKNTYKDGPLLAVGCHFDWSKRDLEGPFEEACRSLIRRTRADLGLPDLPWIFTRISPCFKNAKNYQAMYGAADRIAADMPPMGVVTTDDFVDLKQVGKEKADTGPEGPMHYTHQGFWKWTERAMVELEKMKAVERAIARLDAPATPYPSEVERVPRWPISQDPDQPVLTVHGEITRVTKAQKPGELGPYPNALMTVEYKVIESRTRGDQYQPDRLIVAYPSVINRQVAPATAFQPGMKHFVVLASLEPQPQNIQQLPMDDDIQDMELPIYYALAVCEETPALLKIRGGLDMIQKELMSGKQKSLITPVSAKGK